MRLASYRNLLACSGLVALSAVLAGCPEKGGAPVDNKASAEPERSEPDDEGKLGEKKPAAAPAPAPAAADAKKPDEDKDKGGW